MASPLSRAACRPLAAAAWLTLLTAGVFAALPKPSGPINDFAGVLDESTLGELKTLAADLEASTTAEIAVVTVSSLDGMSVEEYANKLFKEWGIGQKATDNGVLILVAPNERKMRIEVGYGLEPVLTDGLSGQIIRQQFTPAFKDGRYAEGILRGTHEVAEVVRRNHTLTPAERKRLEEASANGPPLWITIPFFGAFVGIGMGAFGAGVRAKEGFFLVFGTGFTVLPLLMSLVFSRTTFWVLLVIGAVAFVVGLRQNTSGATRVTRRNLRWRWGATSSSSWSSSSSKSSSSSGSRSSGSFSGGSSGGGGSSGSW